MKGKIDASFPTFFDRMPRTSPSKHIFLLTFHTSHASLDTRLLDGHMGGAGFSGVFGVGGRAHTGQNIVVGTPYITQRIGVIPRLSASSLF
jgi:hypothetical protein